MNSPPGYAMFAGPSSKFWLNHTTEDHPDRLIFDAMPEDLKQDLRQFYRRDMDSDQHDKPCCWYDAETKRCRHYEYRPTICREFEPGEEGCHEWRKLYQIQ